MSKYPFNDDLFWPILADVVKRFLGERIETDGPILLDRAVTDSDIAFMQNLKLANMEFQEEDGAVSFIIRNTKSGDSLKFSNRHPGNTEMRAGILREQLLLQKEKNADLTLYEALEDICCGDISRNDGLTYFFNVFSREQAIDESNKQLIKNIAKEMVSYKKSNPTATDDEVIAHGKGFLPPNPEKKSNSVTKFFGFFLIALGITFAFAPIPGLAQILGTWLTAMGLGISVGTFTLGLGLAAAAIGLGIFGFAFRSNQKSHIDQEYQEATLPITQHATDSAVASSLENIPPSASPTDSLDLAGFKDQAVIISEISQPGMDLITLATGLVDSVSTDSGAFLALPVTDPRFVKLNEDKTVRSSYN